MGFHPFINFTRSKVWGRVGTGRVGTGVSGREITCCSHDREFVLVISECRHGHTLETSSRNPEWRGGRGHGVVV